MKKIIFKKGINNIIFPVIRPLYAIDPVIKEFEDNLNKIKSDYKFRKRVVFNYVIEVSGNGGYSAKILVSKS